MTTDDPSLKRDRSCPLVLVCNGMQLHPDAGGVGALSARLELERDGNSLSCWSESDQKAVRRATGPHPQERPVSRSRGAGSGSWSTSSMKRWPGAATGSRATTSLWRCSNVRRRSTPTSTHGAHRGRAACVTSFANTTGPTAKAIPFASSCRRAATRRKSSFGRRQQTSARSSRTRHLQIDAGPLAWPCRSAGPCRRKTRLAIAIGRRFSSADRRGRFHRLDVGLELRSVAAR